MKTVTKVAVTYDPPVFKFEYRKGRAKLKYHKNVDLDLAAYINTFLIDEERKMHRQKDLASNVAATRITVSSREITTSLIESYDELQQVPPSKIECLIKKLLMAHQLAGIEEDQQAEQGHVNMTIQSGFLPVSPLRERPKLKRYDAVHERSLSVSTSKVAFDPRKTESQLVSSFQRDKLNRIGDLNRASDEDLQRAKNEMNEIFQQVQVLPGDEKYVYDRRMDFEEPDEESSWD
jgi:hypothetical protein